MSTASIIIAVSGSGGERPHIVQGLEWARLKAAPVHIVHVVRMMWVPTGYAVGDVMSVEVQNGDPCANIERLRSYVEQVLGRPLVSGEAHFTCLRGDDVEELIELSKGAAGLVLGHHHVGGFLHLFTHTVDEQVINRARCPVLIVPEEE